MKCSNRDYNFFRCLLCFSFNTETEVIMCSNSISVAGCVSNVVVTSTKVIMVTNTVPAESVKSSLDSISSVLLSLFVLFFFLTVVFVTTSVSLACVLKKRSSGYEVKPNVASARIELVGKFLCVNSFTVSAQNVRH